ncbi:MAG: galactokinase, partial [Synergistaceae bacterium]|nr:galactokinase [Synergistaceae bacterium]
MNRDRALALFEEVYGDHSGCSVFFAPGRVNLIGEHTDYNGGHVLPCALSIGTYAAARRRDDDLVRLFSADFPEAGVFDCRLEGIEYDPSHGWANYPKGVVSVFRDEGLPVDSGFEMAVTGDMPVSAGLSSSASLEMAVAVALSGLFLLGLEGDEGRTRMASLGQRVENSYIGVSSGIMDQFAIALGRAGTALFLDCATLERRFIPLDTGEHEIVLINTNKRRTLAESNYNLRREECERALADVRAAGADIAALCDITPADFDRWSDAIRDPVSMRRARHAVYENARVLEAADALEEGRLERFGELLNESHLSLQFDYESTG